MSWSERSVRHHRRETDCAIRGAFAQLVTDPVALKTFHELLLCARRRARRLFEAPVENGRHPGVEALLHLSRFRSSHVRDLAAWEGAALSWRPAVTSLAHHLICRYEVPAFLSSAWYAADPAAERKRRWYVAHSGGVSFRSLNLPMVMTRKMEHIFLSSADHLPIEYAMRKAELSALGVPAAFAREILATRLAIDLRHSEFWRTLWHFLIANAGDVDPTQIGPMIDFIQTVRHERITAMTRDGTVELDPPQPGFSMKGRTIQSMLRQVHAWHCNLGESAAGISWARSPYESLLLEESSRDGSEVPERWQLLELTNSNQLRSEGAALHHCVASYADRCYRGTSSIWSLRLWRGGKVRPVLTIEVDPRRRAVVQVRGYANRAASGKPLRLLTDWAVRERLRMAV